MRGMQLAMQAEADSLEAAFEAANEDKKQGAETGTRNDAQCVYMGLQS